MGNNRQANKRKKMIADVNTQGIIVRKVIAHWTIFTLVSLFISAVIQFCSNPFDSIQSNVINSIRTFSPVLLTLICVSPVFVYDFLKLSNRIFGPIPRIRRTIKKLAKGTEVKPLKTRDNDSHTELVTVINQLIQMVQRQSVETASLETIKTPAVADTASPETGANQDAELAEDVKALLRLLRESRQNDNTKDITPETKSSTTSN